MDAPRKSTLISMFTGLLLTAVITASSLLYAAEVDVERLNRQSWLAISSKHFYIVSNDSEARSSAIARELEQFYYFLSQLHPAASLAEHQRIPIILGRDENSYRSLGIRPQYPGLLLQRGEKTVIFANTEGFSDSKHRSSNPGRQTILHELSHLLMRRLNPDSRQPPWYSEGIAEYYSTYYQRGDSVLLGDTRLLKGRLRGLATTGDQYMSINSEELLKTETLNIGDNNRFGQDLETSRFYARATVLTHYLNATAERRKKTANYLKLTAKGYSVDETFDYLFKKSFKQLDLELDKYLRERKLVGRAFKTGKGGLKFPNFTLHSKTLDSERAMMFLSNHIGLLSERILEKKHRQKMYRDIALLYPKTQNKPG